MFVTILPFKALRFTFLLFFLLLGAATHAQTNYGNEWINYEQTYHKIKVTQTGIHQLDHAYLSQLGLANVNPQNLQLFRRGKEVAIYVAGEQDGKLDPQDYLEFYGERNDGALDRELYKDPTHQHHQFFSLYTDTASYFLTVAQVRGKRVQQKNTAATGLTPEPYFIQKALQLFTTWYYQENVYNTIAKMPWIDEGEGYTSARTIAAADHRITGITNVYTTGPTPFVDFKTVGAYKEYHKLAVNIVAPGGSVRELGRYEYEPFSSARDIKPVYFNEINSNGSITLRVVPDVTETRGNAIVMSYGQVTYPQRFSFNNTQHIFYTDSLKSGNFYYEFPNATTSLIAYDATDPLNVVRVEVVTNTSGRRGIVVENNGLTKKIVVANATKIYRPAALEKSIRFRKITPEAHNYIVLTNKRLMRKALGSELNAPVQYAAYRASQAGGGYDTLVVHLDQVIDQFHYGEFSSNSIRRFMKFMATSPRQKQLFIIGKGLKYAADDYRVIYSNRFSYYHIGARHPKVYEMDLVPTGITPGSDLFFTIDFHNNSVLSDVPTGRLSATKPEDVINYLNKVKEHESLPDGLPWRKNILQLSGGSSPGQISRMSNYMNNYKRIAEGPLLGAHVIEKYRRNVSQVTESVNVVNEVNEGVSLITFFGHSSTSTTDLDIGFASSPVMGYKNKGKYPFILMNGCGAGDAFTTQRSFGEDWTTTPDKGSIGFISHIDSGEETRLNEFSYAFYHTAFRDENFYGKPIGEIQRQVNKTLLNNGSMFYSEIVKAMVLEMVLQADPALILYSPAKPDYAALENGADVVSAIEGEMLTASSESFKILVDVRNWGKAITDSVTVSVKRTLADNTDLEPFTIKVAPIMYSDTLVIPVDNRGIVAQGMNRFEVTLDGNFEVDELDESNNTVRFQHFFPAGGLVALTPSKYSIVTSKNVKVMVQTTQVEDNRQGYYLEVDTTHHFNSNVKKAFTQPAGLLPTWDLNLAALGDLPDSTVYYWRVRFQNYSEGEDTLYAGSSFRVINGAKAGWSQSHAGQFKESELNAVALKEKKPLWEFTPIKSDIEIRTTGGSKRFVTPDYNLIIDGRPTIHMGCSSPASSATPRLIMVVINNKTLKLVENIVPAYACTAEPFMYEFGDLRTAANRAKLETFINAIPDNYYVAAISINNVPFNDFTAAQKAALGMIGSELIDNLKTGDPFAIVGQKGAAKGTAVEVTAVGDDVPANQQDVVLNTRIFSNQEAGEITSSLIGPALSWGSLHYNIEKYKAGDDNFAITVVGVGAEGNQTVLTDEITSKSFDLSNIDATAYPYLQLKATLSDPTDRTAPQLDQWLVFYDVAPEGIIRPDLVQVSEAILTEQANKGKITMPMVFQNITPYAFRDSLAVDVTVTGDGIQPIEKRLKLAPLAGNSNATFNFELNTLALDGNYRITVYVNPRLQPEQHYFNNIFVVPFKVSTKLHPIMDVAFDGVHIMDGELISPSPLISVTVKDENKFAYLEDASGMTVVLIGPEGEKELSLDKTSEDMEHVELFPATEKSDFRIEFKPKRLEDGKYTMEVRGRDVSGKQSGISPYRINFEVENRSSITNFYPFPNPFSSKTQFIFTLTGATIPDHIKIQILTITGKVVKEIMKEELGPLRIGNNKTEYAWDGTDMYGDKLANGVYLYRVVVSQSEERMFHKQKFGDKAFKNGYGKIYILR